MPRVNVFAYPFDDLDFDGEAPQLDGWFVPEAAVRHDEDTRWDGNNHVSVNSVGKYEHQALYRTKGGRWVRHTWSQRQGAQERYEFLKDYDAKIWLMANAKDEAVERWFGEVEEESRLGGRPAVGTKVETRLPDDVLAALDERAKSEGITRAEMMRRLVTANL